MNARYTSLVLAALATVAFSAPAYAGVRGGNVTEATSYNADGQATGSVVVDNADPCRDSYGNWTSACGETHGQLMGRDAGHVGLVTLGSILVDAFHQGQVRRNMRDAAGYRQAEIRTIGVETRANQDNATDNNIRLNTSLYELQRGGRSTGGNAGNGNVRVNTQNCGQINQGGRTVNVCEVSTN